MVSTGTRRGGLIYHWRHGWIPLDHFAALSKAKGSHKGAAKLLEKHGISAPKAKAEPKRFSVEELHPDLKAKGFAGGATHVVRDANGGGNVAHEPDGRLAYHKGKAAAQRSADALNAAHATGSVPSYKDASKAVLDRIDAKRAADAKRSLHNSANMALRKSAPLHPDVVKDLRGGSADKHLVTDATGTHFSAERTALHDKIIGQIVGGHKSHDKPAFVMLGGGPASGKTKAAEAAARDFPGAVTINPDDIKAMLPEYKQLGPDKAAAFTHEESSHLAKQAMAAAIAQRSHIILDAVGDNSVKSVEGKVASAHAAGYSTHARYVTVPTQVAQARAVSRGIRSGRVVPPTVIAHAHAGVSDVFPQVMGKFDTASLHDNTTNWKPVLTTARGQAPTIHDSAAYRAFLRKAKAKG